MPSGLIIQQILNKACDKGLFACRVYLDLKKAFDTVNHNILLTKLEYYRIKGKANYWLRSFLTDRKQYASVTGKDSNFQDLSVTSSKVHHFADDTNLLLINKSLKKINSLTNHDLALADYIKLLNCLFVKSILSNNHLQIYLKISSKKQKSKLILIQLKMLQQTRYSYHSPKLVNMESSP